MTAAAPSDASGAKLKLLASITRESDGQRVATVRLERAGDLYTGTLADPSRIANTGKQEVKYRGVLTAKGGANAVAFSVSEAPTLTVCPPATDVPAPGL